MAVNMKLRLRALLIVATTMILILSKDSVGHNSSDNNEDYQLQLTTSIINNPHYCDELLFIELQLNYTNTGRKIIVLYKKSEIYGYKVSRSIDEALLEKYEAELYFH